MPENIEASAGVSEGTVLAGKYRVERVLGVGGMGVVVAARHLDLDERVAIKFLLPEMLGDPAALARFQREAKAAARIKSEHVARVFDVDRLPNGAPYMVMEFLQGGDLAGWLSERGPLPVQQAVDFVLQTCVAVADAHALGIIHRDLKPANLFCTQRSDGQLTIKVLDFGISKVTDLTGAGMSFTKTSTAMGSPLYMSPEQMRSSKNVDTRTDIWALGAILYELLTGRPPFSAETVTELAIKVAVEPTPQVQRVRADVPLGIDVVVAKCLQKSVEARYRNVAEMANALLAFGPASAKAAVERISAILGGFAATQQAELFLASTPSERASLPPGTAPAIGWTNPAVSRRGTRAVVLGLVGVVVASGIAAAAWLSRNTAASRVADPETFAQGLAQGSVSAQIVASTPPSQTPVLPPIAASAVPPEVAKSTATPSPAPLVSQPPPVASVPKGKTKRQVVAGAHPGAAVPTPPAAPHSNCDPPYFFDGNGNRIFKQECL